MTEIKNVQMTKTLNFQWVRFDHFVIWYSNLFRISDLDLPAHACLVIVLQPPQAVRQEQINAIMQTGQWQAGIRILPEHDFSFRH